MAYTPMKNYTKNIIARWVFDNTGYSENNIIAINGSTVNDLSGNNNNLSMSNISFIDDSDLGRCAVFNGTNSRATIAKHLLPYQKHTVLVEMKYDDQISDYGNILDNRDSSKSGFSINMPKVNPNTVTYSGMDNNMRALFSRNIGIEKNYFEFMFVVNVNNIKIYGGDLLEPLLEQDINPIPSGIPSTQQRLTIGSYTSGSGGYFKGRIKSITLFNEEVRFVVRKFLVKQEANYILINNNYYNLGRPKDDNQLIEWYKKYGYDKPDIISDKLTIKDFPFIVPYGATSNRTMFELDANDIKNSIEFIEDEEKGDYIRHGSNEYRIYDKLADRFDKFEITMIE